MRYTVRSGDTLSAIAARHHVSLAQLERANPQIQNPDLIFVGQQVALPGAKDGFDHGSSGRPTASSSHASTTARAAHPGPVKQLQQDLAKLRKDVAAENKAQHQEKVDVAAGKKGQAEIAKQKDAIIARLTDATNPPDAATEAQLLKKLSALGQQSARLEQQTNRAVASDKKEIAADTKHAKADKAKALKDLKPAEYKLDLARTNRFRKALGLAPVKHVIRPPGPTAPKSFKPLTPAQFSRIAPNLGDKAKLWTRFLNDAMIRYHITTPQREAAFIAQITEETDGMNTLVEYASGWEYEGNQELGNTQKGDGPRFKGRGAIQLTGRANYTKYSKEMGVDLLHHPGLAARPRLAFRIAGQYWVDHGLNHLADKGDFLGITRAINGGTNGLSDRLAYWAKAKRVLGIG